MTHLFQSEKVKYLCSCGSLKPLCKTYFCRHCLALKCGDCVFHEVKLLCLVKLLKIMSRISCRSIFCTALTVWKMYHLGKLESREISMSKLELLIVLLIGNFAGVTSALSAQYAISYFWLEQQAFKFQAQRTQPRAIQRKCSIWFVVSAVGLLEKLDCLINQLVLCEVYINYSLY